ncbi:MAG: hypothetical protein ACI8YQ_001132 [Polaribacter sp.]|jgi:hypothetical protein
MNFKSTLIKGFCLALMLAFTGSVSAQIFWSQDFADGFPTDWVSEDISANYDTEWLWCEGPVDPPTGDCSTIFAGAPNDQTVFQASTAANGFLTLNSDAAAGGNHANDPHISVLTTSLIDCSAQSVVWLKFESHIGCFELDQQDNAILRVSNDGSTWSEFTCYPGLTTTERWSDNPEDVIVNITDVAAGQDTVYLQLQWTAGWEYFWNIDDMILSTENPTAPNDMQVNSNFFAIAPNAQTPASQVETFGFLADVENVGSQAQTGVTLDVAIFDDVASGTAIYEETLLYPTILSDSIDENRLFNDPGFTPTGTPATYTGTYIISSDSVDTDLSNNMLTFDFEVTETVFAKDKGVTSIFGSAEGNWDDDENFSWAYGNHYHVVNGTGWWANEVVFGIGNATDDNVAGQTISIKLYEWDDANEDGNVDPDEKSAVGFNTYEIQGNEGTVEDDLITLPILDNFSLAQGVSLSDDTDYALVLEYAASDQTAISFLGSNEYDYSAQSLRTQELGAGRYGSLLGVNDPLDDEIYTQGGFGGGANVPIARLLITDELESSITTLSADNKVNVFPSPAQDYIDVALDLTEVQSEITLSIVNIAGKTIGERQLSNVQENTYRFDLSILPVGSYFLNLRTADGARNVPFIIAR